MFRSDGDRGSASRCLWRWQGAPLFVASKVPTLIFSFISDHKRLVLHLHDYLKPLSGTYGGFVISWGTGIVLGGVLVRRTCWHWSYTTSSIVSRGRAE